MYFPLRRYVWVVDLIGILVGAGLAGHAVATRIAGAMPADPSAPPGGVRAAMPAPVSASTSTFVPAGPMSRSEALQRVRKIGPYCYEVPPGILGQFAGIHPPSPLILPETRDAEPVGVRLFHVERNGLLPALGLANGDVVLELDGVPLRDPGALLDAYTANKTADHAWLWIERGGRRMRIDYVVAADVTAPRGPGLRSCRTCCRNRSP
jgi:hypothetical protein